MSEPRTFRIWSAEYPEEGVLWEGVADDLEQAKRLALPATGYEDVAELDGCDASEMPPLLDEEEAVKAGEAVKYLLSKGFTAGDYANAVARHAAYRQRKGGGE